MKSVKEAALYSKKLKEQEDREKKDKDILEKIQNLQDLQNKKEEKRITINRQLLILHYTGLLNSLNFPTNEKMYSFFHLVIDKNKQAVKDFCINRNKKENSAEYLEIFNEEDLQFVSQFFQQIGLIEALQKVNSDILRLKY